ncbi:MAG: plastocyanin/azurin family copper-binding protein [Actinomycetota bacterium]
MKKVLALFALALAGIALVACGSSSNDNSTNATSTSSGAAAGGGGGGGGQTVSISADPNGALKFDTTSLSAKAGSDTFDFTNDAPIAHDFTIETSSGQKVAATPIFSGGTKSVTATLKPGTYTFLCTVPGHADAGMKGTLTVK